MKSHYLILSCLQACVFDVRLLMILIMLDINIVVEFVFYVYIITPLFTELVFRVYYERPMVIDSLNLKPRQIAIFSSNMILDEMSSAKCHCLLFEIFFDCSTRRKTTLPCTYGNFSFLLLANFISS